MANKYSLHIGISKYNGANSPKDLKNPVNDALALYRVCNNLKMFDESVILKNEQVNFGTLVDKFFYFSQLCKKGDLFVFTYAGHGVDIGGDKEYSDLKHGYRERLKKAHGEPGKVTWNKKYKKWMLESGSESAWLINNKDYFYDNLLTLLIKCFAPGVRILAIMDSCQNASMIDTHNLPLSDYAINDMESKVLTSRFAIASQANSNKIKNIFHKLKIVNKQNLSQAVIVMSAVWEKDSAWDSGVLNNINGLFSGNMLFNLPSAINYFDLHSKIYSSVQTELKNYYDQFENNFKAKAIITLRSRLSVETIELLCSSSTSDEVFFSMVEKSLNLSDVLRELPASLVGTARHDKIARMFEYKWKHYRMNTIHLLSPYYNDDLAYLSPGFENSAPFS